MPPKGRIWQELTWSWAFSTGHLASDQKLAAAAEAAWPYALLYAWTYLNDHDAAHDLMDHAIENTRDYAGRHADFPVEKLKWRMKSTLKRRAQQEAAKRRFEVQSGSLANFDNLLVCQPEAEQRVYARELLECLSPFARSIANRRWLGYDTVKSTFNGDVRELQELRLWEVSVVTFPMNQDATVTAIKAISDDDRARHLKSIDTHRKAIDRHQRGIREHLKSLFDGIDDDDASGDDLSLLEDEGDDEGKAFLVDELKKLAAQASSTLNGGDSSDSLGPLCRSRIFGAR